MQAKQVINQLIGPSAMRLSWNHKVALAVLLAGLVPLISMFTVTYFLSRSALQQRIFEHLESVATIQEHRVSNLARQNFEKLELVSSRSLLRWSLASYLDTGNSADREKMNVILHDVADAANWMQETFVVDPSGTIVASTNQARIGHDVSRQAYFRNGMHKVFLDVIPHADAQLPLLVASGPLMLDERRLGVVVVLQSGDELLALTSDYAGLGNTGEGILARREGNGSSVYLTPLRFDTHAALVREVKADAPMNHALDRQLEARLENVIDYRGRDVIAVTRYVPAVDWGLVVKMDRDEVLAPAAALGTALLTLLAASTLLLAVLGSYLGRKMGRTAEQLRKSEQRFRSVAQYASDAIITANQYGLIETWNEGAENMFGYAAEEVVGETISKLMPERFKEAHEGGIARAREENKFRIIGKRVELVGLRRDGTEFPIEICVDAWHTDAQLSFSAIIRDITERKQVETELRQAKETAEIANSELESFAYSVSHDLRAPLRSIDGFSRFLEDELAEKPDGVISADAMHYLKRIRKGTDRMERLIDSLLEFSRIGQQSLQMKKVSTKRLVNEVLETLATSSGENEFRIHVDPLPDCTADPMLLRLVFMNLISNAMKFTMPKETPDIRIGFSEGAFFVNDNGVGFDMRYAEKLFQVFQRLHSEEEFKGTGIGLALAHRIIERHGGHMWAEGEEGIGASFRFTLPSAEADR